MLLSKIMGVQRYQKTTGGTLIKKIKKIFYDLNKFPLFREKF